VEISLTKLKTHFSAYIRNVETEAPIIITKYGKPIVALIHITDFALLNQHHQKNPPKGLASIAGGWNGSMELADILDHSKRM